MKLIKKVRTKSGNTKLNLGPVFNDVQKRWYVIASRVNASLYRDLPKRKFALVKEMENEEGRRREKEFASDGPGRRMASSTGMVRHSLGRESIHHEKSAREFSAKISHELEVARQEGLLTELIVVAEPHFLGLMRASFPNALKKVIKHEIQKDYYTQDAKVKLFSKIKKQLDQIELQQQKETL